MRRVLGLGKSRPIKQDAPRGFQRIADLDQFFRNHTRRVRLLHRRDMVWDLQPFAKERLERARGLLQDSEEHQGSTDLAVRQRVALEAGGVQGRRRAAARCVCVLGTAGEGLLSAAHVSGLPLPVAID